MCCRKEDPITHSLNKFVCFWDFETNSSLLRPDRRYMLRINDPRETLGSVKLKCVSNLFLTTILKGLGGHCCFGVIPSKVVDNLPSMHRDNGQSIYFITICAISAAKVET